MFDFKNVAPAMSMLDVIRAATRTCDSTANCRLNCAYYHFCESLKRSYYEVLRACDDNPELRSFIEQAIDKLHETGWMQKHDKEMTERPTGKWIQKCEDYYDGLSCSVCGKFLPHSDEYRDTTNYCPNCGAKMEVK
jgi:hypothetical protein